MRQGHQNNNNNNNKRMRGRNRKGPNPLTRSYESNGPDVKVRGTPLHIAERYAQLARDAQSSGDRVHAESLLQHAEHYYRIVAAAQAAQPQPQNQPQQNFRDGDDGDNDGDNDGNNGNTQQNRNQSRQENERPKSDPQPASDPQPHVNGNGQDIAAAADDQPQEIRPDDQGSTPAPRPRRRRPYRARTDDQNAAPRAEAAAAEPTPVED